MNSSWFRQMCIVVFWFISVSASAQKKATPIVRLGKLDTAHVTCDELLKNTRLVAADAKWEVTRFVISFTLEDGKTYGPYPGAGAELPEQAIKTIKRLKKTKAEIIIAQINVAKNGVEQYTYPITLRYNN